jgi:hypothetical protein
MFRESEVPEAKPLRRPLKRLFSKTLLNPVRCISADSRAYFSPSEMTIHRTLWIDVLKDTNNIGLSHKGASIRRQRLEHKK